MTTKPDDVGDRVDGRKLQVGDYYYTKFDKNASHAVGPTQRMSPIEMVYSRKQLVKVVGPDGSVNENHPNSEYYASKANPPGLAQARKASLANPPKVFTKPFGGKSRRRRKHAQRRKTRHRK
jgi:hypothetical protein